MRPIMQLYLYHTKTVRFADQQLLTPAIHGCQLNSFGVTRRMISKLCSHQTWTNDRNRSSRFLCSAESEIKNVDPVQKINNNNVDPQFLQKNIRLSMQCDHNSQVRAIEYPTSKYQTTIIAANDSPVIVSKEFDELLEDLES